MKYLLFSVLTACLVFSCTNRKKVTNSQTERFKYRPLGSVIRIQDSNKVQFVFVQLNFPIQQLDTIRRAYYTAGSKGRGSYYQNLGRFFNYDSVYSKEIFDTSVLKWFFSYRMKDSLAPQDVMNNILSDSCMIYSEEDLIMNPNVVWYCINGYLPMEGCYEGPRLFINYRKEMGINGYRFKIE